MTMSHDYETETKPLLTTRIEEAVCFCDFCGRMYTKRPFLCCCRSNVFLRDIDSLTTAEEQKRDENQSSI